MRQTVECLVGVGIVSVGVGTPDLGRWKIWPLSAVFTSTSHVGQAHQGDGHNGEVEAAKKQHTQRKKQVIGTIDR